MLYRPDRDPSRIDKQWEFTLSWASNFGHAEVVRLLLADSRVDPAANENEAIRYASRYGHHEVVRLLLADSRVDPAAIGNQAFQNASVNGRIDVASSSER